MRRQRLAIARSAASIARRVSFAPPLGTRPTARRSRASARRSSRPSRSTRRRRTGASLGHGRGHGRSLIANSACGRPRRATRARGEVNIAYQVVGEGPLDLVFVSGWVSNLDLMWAEPSYARFLRQARVVLAADPLRQAGDGPLRPRPGRGPADARGADGRRPRRPRRRRRGAGGAARPLRGRPDVPALRGNISGAHRRARAGRDLRACASWAADYPFGAAAEAYERVPPGDRRRVGRCRTGSRHALPSLVRRRAVPDVVVRLPAHERQPGRGPGARHA